VVNLHKIIQCDANAPAESDLCDVSNKYRTQTIRMNELRENSSVNTWLVKLDRYLLKLDKSDWVDATISHISEECLLKIGDLQRFYTSDQGIVLLKEEIKN